MKKPVALMILDGWGYSKTEEGNAVRGAKTPNFDRYMDQYPNTLTAASGEEVGLPPGQMGNSEVGHLNIGAGRVIYQPLMKITKSVKDGDFFEKPEFKIATDNVKKNDSSLHVMGLLSDGGVHSHIEHLKALVLLAKNEGLDQVYVHAFLDGRDTPPRSALTYITDLENYMKEINFGKIATVSGRYYSMDRDQRMERTVTSYDMLVKGEGLTAISAVEAVEASYRDDKDDEFVLPTVILEDGKALATIKENDSVIFANFRPDRTRQMTRALVDVEFDGFEREYFKTTFVCMTQYDVTIKNVEVVFKPETIDNTLGEYLAKQGKKQLRIAETEKYAHVTFFFNGGLEAANEGEDRVLIQSPKVATYDLKPEMSAYELTDRLLEEIDKDKHDLIIVNYANPDMVGHTGDLDAAIKAVHVVDECFGKIADKLMQKEGKLIVTADHGNAEMMIDPSTHSAMTAHTTNLVPLIVAGEGNVELIEGSKLSDIAPTLLKMMDLKVPAEMTGRSIIK